MKQVTCSEQSRDHDQRDNRDRDRGYFQYGASGGCEVWHPIQTSPPSKYSFFHTGTTSLRRSIAKRHASKASARCAADTAIATEVSPIATKPIRCCIAIRTILNRSPASRASLRISLSAIGS